jgi:hypothetical protein
MGVRLIRTLGLQGRGVFSRPNTQATHRSAKEMRALLPAIPSSKLYARRIERSRHAVFAPELGRNRLEALEEGSEISGARFVENFTQLEQVDSLRHDQIPEGFRRREYEEYLIRACRTNVRELKARLHLALKKRSEGYTKLVELVAGDEDVQKHVLRHYSDDFDDIIKIEIASDLRRGKLSDRQYFYIFKAYVKIYAERQAAFQRELPKLKQSFLMRYAAVAPDDVMRVSELLEQVDYRLADMGAVLGDGTGEFCAKAGQVALMLDLLDKAPEEAQIIFDHETLHVAAAGSVELVRTGAFNFLTTRNGLRFTSFVSNAHLSGWAYKVDRFRWMNEAYTEWRALDMQGLPQTASTVYLKERRILWYVLHQAGMYFHDLHTIYTELAADQTTKGRARQWRAFSQKIRGKLGDGFLVRLDQRIQREGLQAIHDRFNLAEIAPF